MAHHRRRRAHTVAVLVMDAVAPFELGVVCEVFGLDRPDLADPWYRMRVCSAGGRSLTTTVGGLRIACDDGIEGLDGADTVVVLPPEGRRSAPERAIRAVRAAHDRGARLISICTGAFVLAQAGVLDGRRATTHWRNVDQLAEQFPRVKVDPNVLYVDDGQVMTSAGSAAGIDLCLHIVRLDHGAEVANALARRMVVPPHRDGGQAQYVEAPMPAPHNEDSVAATLDWAVSRLDRNLTVDDLAHQAYMSPRTFARRFREATGTTPLQWLLHQRITLARRLLETTATPVELVALQCGFGSATALRTHFKRRVGVSPMVYRRTFHRAAS